MLVRAETRVRSLDFSYFRCSSDWLHVLLTCDHRKISAYYFRYFSSTNMHFRLGSGSSALSLEDDDNSLGRNPSDLFRQLSSASSYSGACQVFSSFNIPISTSHYFRQERAGQRPGCATSPWKTARWARCQPTDTVFTTARRPPHPPIPYCY